MHLVSSDFGEQSFFADRNDLRLVVELGLKEIEIGDGFAEAVELLNQLEFIV